ncbi:MAG TPA: hypothetical protein PKC39_09920 [Ferruginibacter sp.]|nr:hypothetical protein [Ferruginibacter sp.]HMP21265.1 hypothetical protein [Ferruginibacter sp.]
MTTTADTSTQLNDISIIIPAREGSSRIQRKVHLPFTDELSLLEWKIDQLKKIHPGSKIIVSSNSANIKNIAANAGVNYHERSDYLSVGHQASFSEVITGIVKDIETAHFAWITVVVPLMSPEEVLNGFKAYIDKVIINQTNDSLVAVNLLKEYLWDEYKPINYEANRNHTISQNLPNIYKVTNGLYMSPKEQALRLGYFLGSNPYKFVVSKLAGIDIDEWEDYEFARSLVGYYNQTADLPKKA